MSKPPVHKITRLEPTHLALMPDGSLQLGGRATLVMSCPYCGCECDRKAVGDHDFMCEGYGEGTEHLRDGPTE